MDVVYPNLINNFLHAGARKKKKKKKEIETRNINQISSYSVCYTLSNTISCPQEKIMFAYLPLRR